MAFAACDVSVASKNGKVKDIVRANKYVDIMKKYDVALQFPNIGCIEEAKLIVFMDASFANLPDAASQAGFIVVLYGNNKCAPISWKSQKLQRVVKSTLAAKTLAMENAVECAFMTKKVIFELFNLQNMDILPIECYTDHKSLFEAIHSTKAIEGRRVMIDICVLRDKMRCKEINSVRRVESRNQLADSLTKFGASMDMLCEVLNGDRPIV